MSLDCHKSWNFWHTHNMIVKKFCNTADIRMNDKHNENSTSLLNRHHL